jgi:importin subunit alpha-1
MNMENPANMSLLGNVTWAISNLCRGKPAPDMALVAPAIEPLAALLHKEVSVDVLVDAVWALSYLSDGPNERIERVMQTGVTAKLVEFLEDKTSLLLIPTIRCLGNFVTGSDVQTQVVLDAGILDHLSELLDSPRRTIRKESCWLASNISAGTNQQISLLMHQPGVMQRLVENANQGAWETRKEALWTLSNVCTTGTDNHVMALIQCEGLQPLAEVLSLKNADATILCAALDAIERVLEVSDRHSNLEYGRIFDEYNGIDYLESLQEHPSDSVYKKTVKIIEAYFGADEEQEDENLAPTTTDSGTFGFGISSPKQLFGAAATDGPAPVFQFGGVSNRAF